MEHDRQVIKLFTKRDCNNHACHRNYVWIFLQVADGAIHKLGDRSHCLTELNLDHCVELTSAAVEILSKVRACISVNLLTGFST